MVRISAIFLYSQPIKEVLTQVREAGGRIVDFDPDGPSGGNPELLLEFDKRYPAFVFEKNRYQDDSDQEINDRIVDVDQGVWTGFKTITA